MLGMGSPHSRHRHKMRALRGISDEEWQALGEVTAHVGVDRSAVIRQFIAWYLGLEDELPERPTKP